MRRRKNSHQHNDKDNNKIRFLIFMENSVGKCFGHFSSTTALFPIFPKLYDFPIPPKTLLCIFPFYICVGYTGFSGGVGMEGQLRNEPVFIVNNLISISSTISLVKACVYLYVTYQKDIICDKDTYDISYHVVFNLPLHYNTTTSIARERQTTKT